MRKTVCFFYKFDQSIRRINDFEDERDFCDPIRCPRDWFSLMIAILFCLERIFINKTKAATSPQFARNSEVIPLTEAQKLGIVRAHNIYRNAVVPKAANMNALLWSEQVSFRN